MYACSCRPVQVTVNGDETRVPGDVYPPPLRKRMIKFRYREMGPHPSVTLVSNRLGKRNGK